jgi:primosomal protein N'
MSDCGLSYAQLKALCTKGLLEKQQKEIDRSLALIDPAEYANGEQKPLILNEEQSAAYSMLSELTDSGEPKAALLHGVTGSG